MALPQNFIHIRAHTFSLEIYTPALKESSEHHPVNAYLLPEFVISVNLTELPEN